MKKEKKNKLSLNQLISLEKRKGKEIIFKSPQARDCGGHFLVDCTPSFHYITYIIRKYEHEHISYHDSFSY
jgi:hypothetical protein